MKPFIQKVKCLHIVVKDSTFIKIMMMIFHLTQLISSSFVCNVELNACNSSFRSDLSSQNIFSAAGQLSSRLQVFACQNPIL